MFRKSDCNPNGKYDFSSLDTTMVRLRTLRAIKPNDEIFVKYGPEFFETYENKCRTRVNGQLFGRGLRTKNSMPSATDFVDSSEAVCEYFGNYNSKETAVQVSYIVDDTSILCITAPSSKFLQETNQQKTKENISVSLENKISCK